MMAKRIRHIKHICKCGELAILDMGDAGWLCSRCTAIAMDTPEIRAANNALRDADEYLQAGGLMH